MSRGGPTLRAERPERGADWPLRAKRAVALNGRSETPRQPSDLRLVAAPPKINCPHCGRVATIRTSRSVSRITRELYCQCSNVICCHTFVSLVDVVRTLLPEQHSRPRGGPPACRPL
ncbi:ogr/Delta-like zinc finger family protein [Ralstonia solanacearum]|uniref:ogr/Delta-like zinc finger family protein n=1 Tax=Ralstonia solanacearum TaxID=305 RepID=UPI002E23A581